MPDTPPTPPVTELARLTQRLTRERGARREAERIAEEGLRSLYRVQQEVTLLKEIAVAANRSTSVDETIRFALGRVCAHMGWTLGHAYLCRNDEQGPVAIPTGWWHAETQFPMERFRAESESLTLPRGSGLPGQVLASGGPRWLNDVTQDGNFPRVAAARECGLRSAFAFPVLTGKEIVAVLEFFSRDIAQPEPGILEVMSHVGTLLGRVVERKQNEDRLIHNAFHDPLTELPNRTLFLDRLAHCLHRSKRRPEYQFAVMFVDLDRFKVVNDGLGHLAGDQLIVEVSRRLALAVRRDDVVCRNAALVSSTEQANENTVARIGGDEFTILLDEISDVSDSLRVAERIQQRLGAPFIIDGRPMGITASIGIALSESGYDEPADMLRDADTSMYHAKALGRACIQIFDPAMREKAVRRVRIEADLRLAIQREELRLHYQPIVALRDNRIVGFEALIRWQHPERGLISPGEFLPIAEETNLIVPMGEWVLHEGCRQMEAWHRQFPVEPPLTIAINISEKQFAQPNLLQHVREALTRSGLDPHCLKLEITENAAMRDVEKTAATLQELRALGTRLSIDDFGTGYSSLSYLRRFPIDTLKIDRSFVADIENNSENRSIVETIIALAHTLGMEIVAEGTETAGQVSALTALACEFAQGYFFAKPLEASAVAPLLVPA